LTPRSRLQNEHQRSATVPGLRRCLLPAVSKSRPPARLRWVPSGGMRLTEGGSSGRGGRLRGALATEVSVEVSLSWRLVVSGFSAPPSVCCARPARASRPIACSDASMTGSRRTFASRMVTLASARSCFGNFLIRCSILIRSLAPGADRHLGRSRSRSWHRVGARAIRKSTQIRPWIYAITAAKLA
jgi:hypothetical protein